MTEERDRQRYKLRWRVLFRAPSSGRIVYAETENISTRGFYCRSDEPFSPGDVLECEFFIPERVAAEANLVLRRTVKVIRVEMSGRDPGFGIACTFEADSSQTKPEIEHWAIQA